MKLLHKGPFKVLHITDKMRLQAALNSYSSKGLFLESKKHISRKETVLYLPLLGCHARGA